MRYIVMIVSILVAGILVIGSMSIVNMKDEIGSLKVQENKAQNLVVQLRTKIYGENRDIITCQDVQNLGIQSYWLNGYGELQATNVELPAHCINR